MKIIVTGACGFIGSHLCEKLLLNDHTVIGIDNYENFYSKEYKKNNISTCISNDQFILFENNLAEINSLEVGGDIDCIIHLAASPGVRYSFENTQHCLYNNINITEIILKFAVDNKIAKVIFASSSSVYGTNNSVPWKEEESLMPISPYAFSKLSGESLGKMYSSLYDLNFLSLRFFTVYGPRQRPDLAIHKFFLSILNQQQILIYGDGNTYRDYTFIDDIVNGILNSINLEKKFEIINLGNGKPTKIIDLLHKIELITSKKAKVKFVDLPIGDVPKTYAQINKARLMLNYNPSTTLEQGLAKFYNWLISNG